MKRATMAGVLIVACTTFGLAATFNSVQRLRPSPVVQVRPQAERRFPDTPENHWAYLTIALCKVNGWLVGHDIGRISTYSYSPTEFAQMCVEVSNTSLKEAAEEFVRTNILDRSGTSDLLARASLGDEVRYWKELESGLIRMAREFAPEIRAIGADPDKVRAALLRQKPVFDSVIARIRTRLVELGARPMFSDVPENHWAFEAIEELQELGILNGYPDGKFRGQH